MWDLEARGTVEGCHVPLQIFIHLLYFVYGRGVAYSYMKIYRIPQKPLLKYLQLKIDMSSRSRQIVCIKDKSPLGMWEGKALLSVYYNILMSASKDSATDRLNAWREDVQEDMTEIDRSEARLKAQTINIRLASPL